MELTEKERLILFNQYRILEKLYPEDEKDCQIAQKILAEGYTIEYDSLAEFMSDGIPREVCEEVIDILQMYRSLYTSYKELSDKTGINKGDVIFQGFDGNEETDHYVFACFYLEDLNRYSEFKGVDINSHSNRLYKYLPMLSEWRKYGRYDTLNMEQIIKIINAYK